MIVTFLHSNGGLIKSASGGGTKLKHVETCDIKPFLNGNKDGWNMLEQMCRGVRQSPIQTD